MSYNRTQRVIQKVKPILDKMVSSSKTMEWVVPRPDRVAYNLWEAIRYAKSSDKEEYVKYAILLQKYKIKVYPPDILKAELRPVIEPDGVVIRSVSTFDEITSAIQGTDSELIIMPDINNTTSKEKLDRIELWCSHNGYSMRVDEHNRLEIRKNVNL